MASAQSGTVIYVGLSGGSGFPLLGPGLRGMLPGITDDEHFLTPVDCQQDG
ncbi:hypothetical protein [Pokkaliibacter plantistimulans]|uniref:hypothetical protein n=1 Tax=Pokkaliibacter plantistimulans TaxID=1635171 RepID=UPI001402EC34|nr:hypothetical protein [Pokkaliibacter plantistimulans]